MTLYCSPSGKVDFSWSSSAFTAATVCSALAPGAWFTWTVWPGLSPTKVLTA